MPIIPIRNLGKYGVITDVDPFNIPPEAFSMGVNVRFRNGSIQRSPVFRIVSTELSQSNPRFVSSNSPPGSDQAIVGYLNGRVSSIASGTETDISISGYVNNAADVAWSSCHLADVYYVNRNDRVPWYQRTSDSIMQTLATGLTGAWPSNYRANIIRSCNSALLAFGVQKGGVSFGTMVKTSEFAQAGTIPTNWDPTITGTNATENILAEMEGDITDAQNLGEIMIVYGLNETWTMVADQSTNVWAYHRIFNDAGAINANCSVEVNRRHYVFGQNDLWVHDGVSKQSICDNRVREFIFANLNQEFINRSFVAHNLALKEIYFCFYSQDQYCGFAPVEGCNRSATYNYVTDTWSFDDLPYVYSGWRANVNNASAATYATTTLVYDTAGGTYASLEDAAKKTFVFVGEVNAAASLTARLYAFDLQGPGQTNLTIDTNATLGWTLIHEGIDLDELGADLKGYKCINTIYPQARTEIGAQPLVFSVGASDFANQVPTYSDTQTFDGEELYKLDFNTAGRYLSMKVTHADWHYVNLTGYDVDLDILGER